MSVRVFLVAGISAIGLAAASPASAQSLEAALAAAYTNNPTLDAARADLRAVDEGVSQALAGWRPSLSVAGDAGVTAAMSNSYSGTARNQHREPKSLTLSLSENLYEGGQTTAAIRYAENSVRAQRASLHVSEQTVLLDAATAYMNVVRDQAVVELNINNEQVLRRQLEAAQDRFQVGEITRTDVSQAEARLSGATASRIKAEGDLQASRAGYAKVVGMPPEKLDGAKPLVDLPADFADALGIALKENPLVSSAEYSEAAARDNAEKIRGELLPSLDLTGSAARSLQGSTETSRTDSYTGKVTLTVPLYQSGSVYSRLRAARQSVASKTFGVGKARRDVQEQVSRTWETLQSTKASILSYQAQITAAEVALEGVQREAAVGSRTVLDVLDAEQELLNAKVSLVRAQRDELVASFELKSALGRLTAQALALNVKIYDPAEHYGEVRDKWVGGRSTGDANSD